MYEVKTETIYFGLKMIKPIKYLLLLFPIISMPPMRTQIAQIFQIGPIVPTSAGNLIRPAGPSEPLPQIFNYKRRNADGIRLNLHSCGFGYQSKNPTTAKLQVYRFDRQ